MSDSDQADGEPRNQQPPIPPPAGLTPDHSASEEPRQATPACPVCGGHLVEIRAKLECSRCHTIYETCCEGDADESFRGKRG